MNRARTPSKLSRTKTTVALSGEGADELFGGYLTYRADLIAAHLRKFPQKALRFALPLANGYPVSDKNIGFDYKAKRLLEGLPLPGRASARFLEPHVHAKPEGLYRC